MHALAAPSVAENPRFVAFTYASELLRRHGSYLEALARRKCRNQLDPDDLVQDVFEKVMRAVQPIPEGVNEQAWLSRVLHNLFIDKLRRRAARAERALCEPIAAPAPEDTWWQELTEDEVRATVARLPDKQRVAFELFAFENRSYEDIAVLLGVPKATVGTRILRARRRLREILTIERGG
jgi:RNA polymerase sigma-70 factor (ECF subfamily)